MKPLRKIAPPVPTERPTDAAIKAAVFSAIRAMGGGHVETRAVIYFVCGFTERMSELLREVKGVAVTELRGGGYLVDEPVRSAVERHVQLQFADAMQKGVVIKPLQPQA